MTLDPKTMQILLVVVSVILAVTPVAHALLGFARFLAVCAEKTATKRDDRAITFVIRGLEGTVRFLAWLLSILSKFVVTTPGTAMNTMSAKAGNPSARRPTAPFVGILCLGLVVLSTGCAGAGIAPTRRTLLELDGAVDYTNERVARGYDDAQARAMIAAMESGTFDDAVYERIMRPWQRADAAIAGVQTALLSTSATVTSVEAGRGGDILGSIACAVQALTELTAILQVVHIDVPKLLTEGIEVLQGFASGLCPSPPAAPEPHEASAPARAPSTTEADVEGTS